jgi:anti-anti-sigma factor
MSVDDAEADSVVGSYECFPASVHVTTSPGNVVFSVEGEIDLSNTEQLRLVMEEYISRDHDCVRLDLSKVSYLDSSSLHLLTHLARTLRTRRQSMSLVAPPGSVARRLLAATGLLDAFHFEPDA